MENETILSTGIDIGTTTTHLIISCLQISITGGFGAVPSAHITNKEILYKSPVYFTPLQKNGDIDGKEVAKIIAGEYKNAGVSRCDLKSGAVIITGESARKENASEVLQDISEFAGDFVAAQAGTELESYLAGKGSGADKISEETGCCVANVDIGGGTANISLFENGECVEDCCLNIGGRLIKLNADGTLYLSPTVKRLCSQRDIAVTNFTQTENIRNIKALCDIMAEIIKTALGFGGEEELTHFCTADHRLSGKYIPQIVTFSGGVAACMDKDYSDFEFGDIGVLLAKAVKKSTQGYPCEIRFNAENPIRATVIGAGHFSMEISGSTIQFSDIELPLKNLPCVRELSHVNGEPCAICPVGEASPSFEYVTQLAKEITVSAVGLIEKNIPIVVITKQDFSKALGQCLKRLLPKNYPFICADGIDCKTGDYIDIGAPIAEGKAVPVVVKTLVFGG